MKKISILLFTIFALAIGGTSQGKIETTQKLIELEKGRKGEYVLGSLLVDNFIYSITTIGKGRRAIYTISKYDTKMKLVKKLDWDLDFKEGSFDRFMMIKNNLYVLFKKIDTKSKTAELYAKSLNKNTLKLTSKETLITEKYTNKRYTPSYVIIEENDLVLIYNTKEKDRKENMSVSLKLFGNNLKEIWNKDIDFPFLNKKSRFGDLEITSNGDVYFIIKVTNEDKKKEAHKMLYSCTKNGKIIKEKELSELPEFISDIKIATTPKNEIIIAGYYNEKVEKAWKKGSYFAKIDNNSLSIKKLTKGLFPTTLLMENKTDKVKRKAIRKENKGKDTGLDNYFAVDEIITKEDGGAIIIGEHYKYYQTSSTTTDANGRTSTTYTNHYEYDDILVISINKEGEIEWERIIPKKQHVSGSPLGCGYYRMIVEDKMYFIFNDDRLNHASDNETTENFLANKKNRIISIYEINSEGYIRKDILTDYQTTESLLDVTKTEQIGDKEMLCYMFGKKRTRKLLLVNIK